MPRFHCTVPLSGGITLSLPPGAARHVQVLRLQPGDDITLFDGNGGEYTATVEQMGRSEVTVNVQTHHAIEREASRAVHLAVGMPANDRMDWLVEKATELGVTSVQPLITAHGVLRLSSERAEKKVAHWQAIAIAACEQCGRNRVPIVHPVRNLSAWLGGFAAASGNAQRLILSLAEGSRPLVMHAREDTGNDAVWVLSGPEGGLGRSEEDAALAQGFAPVSLGARVLRAETASMTALALLAPG
jgi:16S rRNA (uracil1498-N3)-methyltransferase